MKAKKFLTTAAAGMLVAAQMVMPVSAVGGDFDVDVKDELGVVRVVVPTSLQIALDQFEQKTTGVQVHSAAFTMENRSNINVKVTVTSSTKQLPAGVTFASKKGDVAAASTKTAWIAMAAATSAGDYTDTTPNPAVGIANLTEDNRNVAVLERKAASGEAATEQVFYLNSDANPTVTYKLIVTDANKKVTGTMNVSDSYAQIYELTKVGAPADAAELATAAATGDIYYHNASAAYTEATGDVFTLIPQGSDETAVNGILSGVTMDSVNDTYYTVGTTVVDPKNYDASKIYVYGEASTGTASNAEFRYIGALSDHEWSATTDVPKINIKYEITGLTATKYDAADDANEIVYGLYKETAPAYTDATAQGSWSGGNLWLSKDGTTGFSTTGLVVEVSDGGTNYTALAADKYSVNDAGWVSTTWDNIVEGIGSTPTGTAYVRITDGTTRYTFTSN